MYASLAVFNKNGWAKGLLIPRMTETTIDVDERGVKTQETGYCVIVANPLNNTPKPSQRSPRVHDNANTRLQGPQTNVKYPRVMNPRRCARTRTKNDQKCVSFAQGVCWIHKMSLWLQHWRSCPVVEHRQLQQLVRFRGLVVLQIVSVFSQDQSLSRSSRGRFVLNNPRNVIVSLRLDVSYTR